MVRRLIMLLVLASAGAQAQPDAIVLVAKPGLDDPNFRETVVLVTRTVDAQTVGVILNRRSDTRLAELWRGSASAENYRDAVFFGGPVMRRTVIALFRSTSQPPAPAFPIMPEVYLSMHPGNIEPLLKDANARYRLFAGFAGWAPRQLENEIAAGGWHVLAAREQWLFREDTSTLWQELVERMPDRRAARERREELAILAP